MKTQNIKFDDEIEKAINKYRGKKNPIPAFQAAVIELCKKGLEADS